MACKSLSRRTVVDHSGTSALRQAKFDHPSPKRCKTPHSLNFSRSTEKSQTIAPKLICCALQNDSGIYRGTEARGQRSAQYHHFCYLDALKSRLEST